MKQVTAVVLSLLLTAIAFAEPQATGGGRTTGTAKKSTNVSAELQQLRRALETQQQQIQQLSEELKSRDQALQQLQQRLDQSQAIATQAQSKADTAAAQASQQEQAVTALKNDITDLKANAASVVVNLQETQKSFQGAQESPAALHYKGITITPGVFLEGATVFRSRAASAGLNTPFTGIPYPGNSLSKVTENNFEARQSRLSFLAEGRIGRAKATGYYEADFLGAGTTSNNRQSNSYVWRTRQAFGQAALDNGWSFTGGQMWSLATENRKGIANRQESLPMQIDPQYVVGFTWARQLGFRVVKNFHDKVAFGFSIEGPQTTLGGRGFSAVTNTSATGTATISQNFWINAPGANGGLLNAFDSTGYTTNKAPDFIAKAAFDPGWGHYELFGVVSEFRARVYPCAVVGTTANNHPTPANPTVISCPIDGSITPSAIGAFNDSRTGGGAGASASWPLFAKKLDFSIKAVGGSGIGRYGSAQLADATARPDGTLALIRTGHWLGRLELHPSPKLDIYAYAGQEYANRAAYRGYTTITVTNTPAIPATASSLAIPATSNTTIALNRIGGYGSLFANNSACSTELAPTGSFTPSGGGSCAGDIRVISEGTIGFWHKFYTGPKGGLRWGIQYSYLTKSGWSGNNSAAGTSTAAGISPKAVDNMIWTSFRYYLP